MKAKLHMLESPNLSQPLAQFLPDDPEDVDLQVVAHIGHNASRGSDLFYFRLLTPKPLARHLLERRFVWGRSTLFVERFDYELLRAIIETMCENVDSESWDDMAERISHYAFWESDPHGSIRMNDR